MALGKPPARDCVHHSISTLQNEKGAEERGHHDVPSLTGDRRMGQQAAAYPQATHEPCGTPLAYHAWAGGAKPDSSFQ